MLNETQKIFNFIPGLEAGIDKALMNIPQDAKWKDYSKYAEIPDNPNNLAWVQMGVCMAWEASELPRDGVYSKTWMKKQWTDWSSERKQNNLTTPFNLQNRWSDNVNAPEDQAVTPVQAWVLRPADEKVTRRDLEAARLDFKTFCEQQEALQSLEIINDDPINIEIVDGEPVITILEDEQGSNHDGLDNLPELPAEVDPDEKAVDLIQRSIGGPDLLQTRWGVGTFEDLLAADMVPFDKEGYEAKRTYLEELERRINKRHHLKMTNVYTDYSRVPFSTTLIANYVDRQTNSDIVYGIMVRPHRQTTYGEYRNFINTVRAEINDGTYSTEN